MKKLIYFLIISILLIPANSFAQAPAGKEKGFVVLLHGLGKSASSMGDAADFMKSDGYKVINVDYPSTTASIIESEKFLAKELETRKEEFGKSRVHFLTHSMGGIVLRSYLKNHKFKNLGRVVMLAPPNHGSEVADFYENNIIFTEIFGPAGNELSTHPDGFCAKLGEVDFDLGVIAGNSSVNPFFSTVLLPGEDDGKVTVENTKVAGMKDHIVVDANHVFINSNDIALNQALYFIENGEFYRGEY